MLPCFAYGCAHTCCWAWGFLCFLAILRPPSGSWSTGSSGYSSPLGFPTFTMGSPLRGRGLFVLDRNKGLVSPFGSGTLVSSWLDLTPLSAASLRALSLRVCCQVVLAVSVSFSCPQLPPVFFPVPCWGSVLPPRPLLWVWVVLGALSYFCRLGFCTSVGGSTCALQPLAPSYQVVLTVAEGRGRFFGSLHCAPLAVGPLPGPPALLCLLSAGCFLGLQPSP